MEHWVASVFHLTDLHLFIDATGAARPLREQHLAVKLLHWTAEQSGLQILKEQVSGFSLPNMTAWTSLIDRLPVLVSQERADAKATGHHVPVLVLQTGDVETFGHMPSPGGIDYPGFRYLRDVLWPSILEAGADAAIDLYGNHDIWSGTMPIGTPIKHVYNAFRRIATVPSLSGPWPDRQVFATPGGFRLEVYRVNSVDPFPLRGSLASGSVGPHPPFKRLPLARSRDAIRELWLRTQHPTSVTGRPIRIVAMHHPPHFFDGSLAERLTNGRLVNALEFASSTQYGHIHLVVAGHRHKLNPPVDRTYNGRAIEPNQSPLNASTAQLVSESPTAGSDLSEKPEPHSMARYRLFADDARRALRVERAVLRYRDGALTQFAVRTSHNVVVDVPV